MERVHDVIVVGAGVVGLAAARALARDGYEVLVLEQFRLGHARGSSHGGSRIFRLSDEDVTVVRRAQRALELWRELEAEAGELLLKANGQLDVWTDTSALEAALSACGVPYELLERAEVERRFLIRAPEDTRNVFQRDGGIVLADRTLQALARSARAHGAVILEETPAAAIEEDGRGVSIGSYRARVGVIAAGSWASRLLAPLGIDLPVETTRETVAYFRLREASTMPSVIESDTSGSAGAYALEAPGLGLKAGLHRSGPLVDPDDESGPDEERVAWLASWVADRFPAADPEPVRAETCLYTSTDDERFLLERHSRVVVGSACSGRGFKFAPLTGRVLADLAGEAL